MKRLKGMFLQTLLIPSFRAAEWVLVKHEKEPYETLKCSRAENGIYLGLRQKVSAAQAMLQPPLSLKQEHKLCISSGDSLMLQQLDA